MTFYALRLSLIIAAIGLLTACSASHPLRIPDEEWVRMSQEEQLRAYERQAEVDRVRMQTRADAQAQERRLKAEADARERQALEERRLHARHGDLVQCVLEPLQVNYRKTWLDTRPLAFDLVRGETRALSLEALGARKHATAWSEFQENGQTLALCRSHSDRYGLSDCTQVLGTTREFQRGIRRAVQIEGFLKGELRCDLLPTRERH